jgi:dTMP kinase
VDPKWVRGLYQFSVKPTIGFYFRIPLEEAMKRILGGRDAIKFHEAGMDLKISEDIEESFRMFQGRIVEEYERMVTEFGLVVIDASLSIEEQQAQMREIVLHALAGTKKTRIRKWVDLNSMVKGSPV